MSNWSAPWNAPKARVEAVESPAEAVAVEPVVVVEPTQTNNVEEVAVKKTTKKTSQDTE